MLSQFCYSSVKILRLTHIANANKLCYSVSALIWSQQKRNYATGAPVTKLSLEFTIKELKARVENKSLVSTSALKYLLTKLRTQTVDSAQALEILRLLPFGLLDQNQIDIVNAVWEELKKQKIDFQVQHYNCLLSSFQNIPDVKRSQAIFDEMIQNGIKPDAISYQCLLSSYCQSGSIEKAIEILGLMDQDNLYINEISYNYLVQCHIICGNIEAAMDTIQNLKDNDYKLNFYTLEALLNHYSKTGDLENIQKIFDMFKEENIVLLNQNIFKVMCNLALNGHADKIDALVPHLKPNIEMRRSLRKVITLCVQNKQSALVPKILQTVDGDVLANYTHLIQQMVRFSSSEQEFNETLKRIEEAGVTMQNHFKIFKPALESSSEEIFRRLLAHMKSRSLEVTENVFKNLVQVSAKKGVDQVLDVVNFMCSDFGIQPQITFIRDTILPGLNVKENPALAFVKLQTTKIRIHNVLIAIISHCLNRHDIKTALEFASANRSFYATELIRRPLLKAFAGTGDVLNFVSFVRVIHDSFSLINDYYRDSKFSPEEIKQKQIQFVGDILNEAITNRRTDSKLSTQLLEAFVAEGLAISAAHAEKIQKNLQVDDGQTQIGRLLEKLSSEELELKPIRVQKNKLNAINNQLSSADVQNILEVKLAQGHNATAPEKLLFLSYVREGNIAEIESLMASGKFSITNADYALLIELYTRVGNLENALSMLKRVCANDASFKLDRIDVAKLVALMVEKGRDFDEIEALLLAHRQEKPEFRIVVFEHLLERLAAKGQVKLVEQLFDALVKYRYIKATHETTRPLVAAHLNNRSYAEAVHKYEYLADTYNLVPMTMGLFKHLIRNNEIDTLQRARDIFQRISGKSNALRLLGFAFVECGQHRQAKAIFENDRTENISRSIVKECKRYVAYDSIEAAKTLLKATKSINCDRHVIYETLLNIYCKQNKAQEALILWFECSTDGILPKQTFKNKLAELLKANNMELPLDLESQTNTNQNKI